MTQRELQIKSTLDGTMQPSLFYKAGENRPLLVGLHTWSYDRFNQIDNMLPFAKKYGFNLLLPEFRGPNLESNPNHIHACGSLHARQDIKDAVDYVVENEQVDRDNIFLLGASGGGHMALLMAGMWPELFKAVGAYVPITDLAKWSEEKPGYGKEVLACCGSQQEMYSRSPVSYLDTIAKANVKICHGKHDPVVPVHHSIDLFNAIMEKYPAASVYLDIFDGGHELDMQTAEYWLISQYRKEVKESVTG